jgi:hypothetical protein
MKKIFGVCGMALIVASCCSMEFLSPEGQTAAQKLKHAEFVLNSSGKIVEIKLKATRETKQYREEVKSEIRQKLAAFYEKNFPGLDYSEYIDKFSRVFDEYYELIWGGSAPQC